MRQAAACLMVAGALAAGCSNGGSSQDRAADTAAARKMVLTSTDLPAGWKAQPKDTSGGDASQTFIINGMADCMHVDAGDFHQNNPKAESPEFDSPDTNSSAQIEVAFTPSMAEASKLLAVLQRDDAEGCLSKAFKQAFDKELKKEGTEGADIGEPTVKRIAVPGVGDDNAAFQVTIPVSAEGQHLNVYLETSFVRAGRIGITGMFGGQGQPFDPTMANQLTQKVIDRAPKA